MPYTRFGLRRARSQPMAQRLRVLFLVPHLGGGGAGQVAALVARSLRPERFDAHMGLVTQGAAPVGCLPPSVTVHALGARHVRGAALLLLRLIHRLKPHVILSGMAHLNFLVLLLRPFFDRRTAVLVRQNGTASAALAFGDLPFYTRSAYRLLYPRADCVICQSQAMADDLAQLTGMARDRLAVLPNPIDIGAIRRSIAASSAISPGAGLHLLAVGRLAKVKGFDLQIRALRRVRESVPRAELTIAGTGPEEAVLKALAADLGLDQAVRFVGHVEQPSALFAGATLFVLSSLHEGLPNALLEAAAGGLPLVATPASGGVVNLLQGQPGAWLAPGFSSDALAASILTALGSLSPGQRFPHPFVEQFSVQHAIPAFEQLIESTAQGRQA